MDRRARAIPTEYRRKLAVLDQQYYGTAPGQVGPILERLESLGGGPEDLLSLCVGAFGDISSDLDRLIRGLAESGALYLSRETGRPLSDKQCGLILSQYRRVFAVTFVRCQSACLVARMGHLGEGAKECAARRRQAMSEADRMRHEAAAHYSAHVRGRGRWAGR